jgi:6-phosphogluconolactonase
MNDNIHVCKSEQALHERAAAYIAKQANEAVFAHNVCHIALAGGTTPAGLYRTLARPAFASKIQWARTHIWFGDERCVAPDHPESNFRMARINLLDRVPLPQANIHRIQGELAPEQAAADYARRVAKEVAAVNKLPRFDLILLGVGTDGHVASLFPGTDIVGRTEIAAAVHVPALDAWRISLTLPVINNANHVVVLAAGEKKADVVRRALQGAPEPQALPVQMVKPAGDLHWYLDASAAAQLRTEPTP